MEIQAHRGFQTNSSREQNPQPVGSHTIEIPFEKLRPALAKQPNVLPHSSNGMDESESDEKLQSPPNLASEDAVVSTPAQWGAAQLKHVELLQALRDAQAEIKQLSAENLELHEANGNLHNEIAQLRSELAAVSCATSCDGTRLTLPVPTQRNGLDTDESRRGLMA